MHYKNTKLQMHYLYTVLFTFFAIGFSLSLFLFQQHNSKSSVYDLTSYAEMTYHARREFFVPNCKILSVSSIFQCNPRTNIDKFITSQQFLSSDITTPTRSKEEDSDEFLHTVRSLVMVREPVASTRGQRNFENPFG